VVKSGRTRLIAGNWKMHGSLAANRALLAELKSSAKAGGPQLAVFSPFPYLAQLQSELSGSAVSWGAQNLSEHSSGAYTGEVSGAMLREFGCRYVLVGHSERRQLFGETDTAVAQKFAAAQAVGLIPVLCVGETLQQREQGETETVVGRQLGAVLDAAGVAAFAHAVVAYEPVWAIGTGRNATPEQAQQVHEFMRRTVAGRDRDLAARLLILYGGSVKPGNARELLTQPDLDGALVGGASLVAADFLAIYDAAHA
jgi:triosephosphate isomerase